MDKFIAAKENAGMADAPASRAVCKEQQVAARQERLVGHRLPAIYRGKVLCAHTTDVYADAFEAEIHKAGTVE